MAGSTVEQLSGLMAAENSRQGYTVQDDGSIAVPSVGRVNLAGMTIEQAEEALFAQLLKAGMDPSISIEINKFASKHIVVGGSVGNPAVIPVGLSPLRLMETLQVAGGVKVPDPDFATVRIYRSGDLYQIPVRDIYDSAKLQNLRLIDGDTVFVDTTYDLDQARAFFQEQISSSNAQRSMRDQALSELDREISLRNSELSARRSNFDKQIEYGAVDRDYVYMSGEVKNQARVALPFNQRASLADVLYGEGGFPTREGNPSQIYVLRGSDNPSEFSGLKAYQLDTRNAVNLILATRFEMRPNDIIFIAEQPVTKWNRAISQITPGDFFGLAATVAAVQ